MQTPSEDDSSPHRREAPLDPDVVGNAAIDCLRDPPVNNWGSPLLLSLFPGDRPPTSILGAEPWRPDILVAESAPQARTSVGDSGLQEWRWTSRRPSCLGSFLLRAEMATRNSTRLAHPWGLTRSSQVLDPQLSSAGSVLGAPKTASGLGGVGFRVQEVEEVYMGSFQDTPLSSCKLQHPLVTPGIAASPSVRPLFSLSPTWQLQSGRHPNNAESLFFLLVLQRFSVGQ